MGCFGASFSCRSTGFCAEVLVFVTFVSGALAEAGSAAVVVTVVTVGVAVAVAIAVVAAGVAAVSDFVAAVFVTEESVSVCPVSVAGFESVSACFGCAAGLGCAVCAETRLAVR